MVDKQANKKNLRKYYQDLRDNLNPEDINIQSKNIQKKILDHPAYKSAQYIMVYLNHRSEVQTEFLIQRALSEGKKIVLPKTRPSQKVLELYLINSLEGTLKPGPFNIREPIPDLNREVLPGKLNLVLVPGVAFDLKGFRLGYGGGYYDRFLASLSPHIVTLGLAFEMQIAESLPVEKNDLSVFQIITEERIIIP